ncbi:MAG: Gfo/Idh/MocA family oxidoreductase [Candidatus Latescibacterota bacterium]|nr:Gfo/Idh/MocA family oxidoreductase [Candidatus Latescibacterota bacterium]
MISSICGDTPLPKKVKMIRTIHLGVGGRGAWPIRQISKRDDFESVALVDVNADNLASAQETSGLGPEACFQRLEDALDAVEADAVVVITPPDMHARQCLDAVRAGKHVLVEKPFTKQLDYAQQVVDEAEELGVKVAVCQNARYSAVHVTMARLVREGSLGKPAFGLQTTFGWRARVHHSGLDRHAYLWERGIHDLDTMRFIFGAAPQRTWGHSFNPDWSPYRGGGGAHGWVEFKGGATCGYMCTFVAHKGGGSFRLELEGGSIEATKEGISLTRPDTKEEEILPLDEVKDSTTIILDGFAAYLENDIEPEFSGRQNLTTVAMVEAMGVASDEGRIISFDEFLQRPAAGITR